jgi:uncharacterized phiE125 gp8 family phage protein
MNNYNIILDTKDVSDVSGPVTEPVPLTDMKDYLRLEGLEGVGDDFDFDDDKIEEFIATARQTLEETLGISIIQHTWQAIGVSNHAGNIQLRYGPVIALAEVLDSDDEAYDTDNTKVYGDYLKKPGDCSMTVTYTAGYETSKIPKPLITEIKRIVAYMYEHVGDEDNLKGYVISDGVYKYSRIPIIN